jgi:hypothetical protein
MKFPSELKKLIPPSIFVAICSGCFWAGYASALDWNRFLERAPTASELKAEK